MLRRKRRRPDLEEELLDAPPPRRISRFRRSGTWFWTSAFLICLVAFGPTLLVNSPLMGWFLKRATGDLPCKVHVGSVELGWLTPLAVQGLQVDDLRGEPMVKVERLEVARALWGLITNSQDLGEVTLEKPQAQLVLRPDGSNVEDLLSALPPEIRKQWFEDSADNRDEPSPLPKVKINQGSLAIVNGLTGEVWRVNQFQGITIPGTAPVAQRMEFRGELLEPRNPAPGQFAAQVDLNAAGKPLGVNVQSMELPLNVAETVLQRFVRRPRIEGKLGTQLKLEFPQDVPGEIRIVGESEVQRFRINTAELGQDVVEIPTARIPLSAVYRAGSLLIEQGAFLSPWAELSAQGRVNLSESAGPTANGPIPVALFANDFNLRGKLEVAQLLTMLPNLTLLRGDTQLTEGQVLMNLSCGPEGNLRVVRGEVRTERLAARRGTEILNWEQPLSANLDAVVGAQTWQVRALEVQSNFGQLRGSGDQAQFAAQATADLNLLTQELSRFFDMSQLALRGSGTANLQFSTDPANALAVQPGGAAGAWGGEGGSAVTLLPFVVASDCTLTNLVLSLPGNRLWQEPRLETRLDARGLLNGWNLARVDQAKGAIVGQAAQGVVELQGPLDWNQPQAPPAPFQLKAEGELAQWQGRATALGYRLPYDLSGQSQISMLGSLSAQAGNVTQCQVLVNNWQASRPAYAWKERQLELEGEGSWDFAHGRFSAPRVSLTGGALTLAVSDLLWEQPPGQLPMAMGDIRFQADLARLGGLLLDPKFVRAAGNVSGTWKLGGQTPGSAAELRAVLERLVLARVNPDARGAQDLEVVWREDRANLLATLTWDQSRQILQLSRAEIQSALVALQAQGSISNLSTTADVDLQGTLQYDLATLSKLLEPRWGDTVRFTGNQPRPFLVTGPLNPATPARASARLGGNELVPVNINGNDRPLGSAGSSQEDPYAALAALVARVDFGWQSADVLGIQVGKADIQSGLREGGLFVERTQVPVNQGQMFLGGRLQLTPPPSGLSLPAGPVVNRVGITPQTCSRGLKFVLPILADATEAEGTFSLALNEGSFFPLNEPKRGTVSGQLVVHGAAVRPGPLTRELIAVAQTFEGLTRRLDPTALSQVGQVNLVRIEEQTTNFELEQGRVVHDQITFAFGDVRLRTSGSVGLDETLALNAEVLLPAAWADKIPRLKPFLAQPVRIAVAGSLKQPLLDRAALDGYYRRAAGQAIRETIANEGINLLEDLIKRQRPQ